ncbi:MAG: acyl-CoA dehydrogenase family protein [Ardenticatenaceae bacterium]
MNDVTTLMPVDLRRFDGLREEVRDFLGEYKRVREIEEWVESWEGYSPEFSRALGERGWIGMTWPKQYGGQARSVLERHVVIEELLAAGAPVAAHWIADRQSGAQLLKFGTEAQRMGFLPRIAKGACYFCIGMSEPDSGSDLASLSTKAEKVEGGWRINGTKVWTTYAHHAHYMLALCRTAKPEKNRRGGLTQFIIDLSDPAIKISPIRNLAGNEHFNEVVFEDLFVSDEARLGAEGNGWHQVMSELTFERSGPDRFLSSHRLLEQVVRAAKTGPDRLTLRKIGHLGANLWTLRHMSSAIAGELDEGKMPDLAAALVKDLGTRFEQEIPEAVRETLTPAQLSQQSAIFRQLHEYATLHTPSHTIRGGTTEILRAIIARGLGLR